MRDAQAEAHRLGVTGIHDVEDERALQCFRRLETSGDLALRVLFHPPVVSLPDLIRRGARSGVGTPWIGMGGVKLFLDGSLGSRTAWMLEPYKGSHDRGMPVTGEPEAAAAMRAAAGNGIAVTVHAIGDAAVRRALDLLERLPRVALPHRIEHLQCIHPADLARASRAGVVASMQPAHLLTDIPLVDRHWGGRGRGAYAFRSLLQRGTTVVFGSDVPVASIDPRTGSTPPWSARPWMASPARAGGRRRRSASRPWSADTLPRPPVPRAPRVGSAPLGPAGRPIWSRGRWTRRWSAAVARRFAPDTPCSRSQAGGS